MPVQANITVGTVGTIAWDGTDTPHEDIRKYNRFGWSFKIVTELTADTTFTFQAAPADEADPCIPGAWEDVDAVPTCDGTIQPGQAMVTLPAGTQPGVCGGVLPCRPGAFVRLQAGTGDTANVEAVLLRQGPRI